MTKIVINIVLMLDQKTIERCQDINSQLSSKIDFNRTDKIPHISLLMGVIDIENQDRVSEIIRNISKRYTPISFEGEVKKTVIEQAGEDQLYVDIGRYDDIVSLFKELKSELNAFLGYDDISLDMFYEPKKMEEISMTWIKGFEKREDIKGSHITLGIGAHDESIGTEISGTSCSIAMFQLGNYCTCENKLFEIKL